MYAILPPLFRNVLVVELFPKSDRGAQLTTTEVLLPMQVGMSSTISAASIVNSLGIRLAEFRSTTTFTIAQEERP